MISLLYSYSKAYTITCPYSIERVEVQLKELTNHYKKESPKTPKLIHPHVQPQVISVTKNGDSSFLVTQQLSYFTQIQHKVIALIDITKTHDGQVDLKIVYTVFNRTKRITLSFTLLAVLLVVVSLTNSWIERDDVSQLIWAVGILSVSIALASIIYFYDRTYINNLHTDITKALRKKH